MSENVYYITLAVMFGTPLVIFTMKYVSAAFQARSRTRSENAYRELVDKTVSAQFSNSASLAVIEAELAKVTHRLTALEKILKEVE